MKEKVFYGKYFVVMMDLLGQKEMYRKLEEHSAPESSEFKALLKKFIGQIEYFKRDVDNFLKSMENFQPELEYPAEHKKLIARYRKKIYKIQRFSDGIMMYVPLAHRSDAMPISSVYSSLVCAGSTMLMSLARGNPIRVGIGIGGGIEIEDGELFGPSIGYAHIMESKRARFPRIALHENVFDYLCAYEQLHESEQIEDKIQAKMAALCLSMLAQDKDNEIIFDYLGSYAWENCYTASDKKLLDPAFKFITEQQSSFAAENNDKVAEKYNYVKDYFENSGRLGGDGA